MILWQRDRAAIGLFLHSIFTRGDIPSRTPETIFFPRRTRGREGGHVAIAKVNWKVTLVSTDVSDAIARRAQLRQTSHLEVNRGLPRVAGQTSRLSLSQKTQQSQG